MIMVVVYLCLAGKRQVLAKLWREPVAAASPALFAAFRVQIVLKEQLRKRLLQHAVTLDLLQVHCRCRFEAVVATVLQDGRDLCVLACPILQLQANHPLVSSLLRYSSGRALDKVKHKTAC